jgi:hypothetical protein
MTAIAYILAGCIAALVALVAALTYWMRSALVDLGNERAALAQSEADLMIMRGNEEAAQVALADAAKLLNALREQNATDRKDSENADTAKILGATGAVIADVSAGVFASMPDDAPANYPLSAASKLRATVLAAANSTRRRR